MALPEHRNNPEYEFVAVAEVTELPEGNRLFLEIDLEPIVLYHLGGEYYAIEDVCSHDNSPLGNGELEGYQVICPRHGARFDVRDGRAISLPAVRAIRSYPVRVQEGQIEVGLPI